MRDLGAFESEPTSERLHRSGGPVAGALRMCLGRARATAVYERALIGRELAVVARKL